MENKGCRVALQPLSSPMVESQHGPLNQDETPTYSDHQIPLEFDLTHQLHDEVPVSMHAPPEDQTFDYGHSTTLHRSTIILFMTTCFAAVVIYSWVILAVLSFRPVSTDSWEPRTTYYENYPRMMSNYAIDGKLYRSARIIQSIASVLILPWTSAVCAHAAVVFVQKQDDGSSMTMRQVMNLADRRWIDGSLVSDLIFGGWRRHGSNFLALAIFAHFLALVIYPIQSIVVNAKALHVPVYRNAMGRIGDLAYMETKLGQHLGTGVVQVRNALAGADKHTLQPQLWDAGDSQIFSTLLNLSAMIDPFFSPLPNGFNTGLLRQYAPRINSNTSVRSIKENEYPMNCESDIANLFADYSSVYPSSSASGHSDKWTISACMLASNITSPWTETRNRQQFSEVLYLNVSVQGFAHTSSRSPMSDLLEVKLTTTAGYFELPSYMNNQTAGPLLNNDPTINCDEGGYGCIRQIDSSYTDKKIRRQDDSSDIPSDNSTATLSETLPWAPMFTLKKGPLLSTALAIFGPGSFLSKFFSEYDTLEKDMLENTPSDDGTQTNNWASICIEIAPLTNMLSIASASYVAADSCATLSYFTTPTSRRDVSAPFEVVAQWILGMFSDKAILTNTVNGAAFLANKQLFELIQPYYNIYQDLGSEILVPHSSVAGVAFASFLLGLYTLFLFAICLYGRVYPRWTSRLDSFAMFRLGAAFDRVNPKVLITRANRNVKLLDEIPGVTCDVGNVTDDAVLPIGRVGLGQVTPLRAGRRYECYDGDNEPLTAEEIRKIRGVI